MKGERSGKEYGVIRRWLHRGKVFCALTWVAQACAQFFVVLVCVEGAAEIALPSVAAIYAQHFGVTTDMDAMSVFAFLYLPMLFVAAMLFFGEVLLMRWTWKKLGCAFGSLRAGRVADLEKRYGNAADGCDGEAQTEDGAGKGRSGSRRKGRR